MFRTERSRSHRREASPKDRTALTPARSDPSLAPREALPDQLRGIALLGIVVVNMPFLAFGMGGFNEASTPGFADRVTEFGIVAFAQGKFYLLFSFLFGYSLTLLLRSRGAGALRRYRRRLLGLAILGLAHATLFFIGDILISYSVLGLGLLWFVNRSDRTAIIGAILTYLLSVALFAVVVLATPSGNAAVEAGLVSDIRSADAALLGSFADAARSRLQLLPEALGVQVVLNWSLAFAMFLLGLVAGRHGLLAHPERHHQLWLGLLLVAVILGLPGGLASATLATDTGATERQEVLAVAIGFVTAPFLSAGYLAVAALATRTRLSRLTEPAGRMSLTGYLGESILLAAIFCGWGLGLLGKLTAFPALLVALTIWMALEVFAKIWLSRMRYGPFEWALRCWTNKSLASRLRAARPNS